MIKIIPIILFIFSARVCAQPVTGALEQLNSIAPISEVEIPIPAAPKTDKVDSVPFFAFSDKTDISVYVKAAIDSATKSVDVAIYGISNMALSEALVNAAKRGVAVRVIMNQTHIYTSKIAPELQYLIDNKINVRSLKGIGKYGIMHNKIAIFDSRILLTGSYNWTINANTMNYENAVFISDSRYIKAYSGYFNWMWNYAVALSQGAMPDYTADYLKFIPQDSSPSVSFNGVSLPSYVFSPNGGVKDAIIKAIQKTKKTLKIDVFSLYDTEIFQNLLDAKNRGVKIQVVVDRVQASQSDVTKLMVDNKFDFRWSSGYNGGVMHNKFCVFDETLVMTGSFNWSQTANQYNFENVFVTRNQSYVAGFSSEFDDVYAKARVPAQDEINSMNSNSPDSRSGLSE